MITLATVTPLFLLWIVVAMLWVVILLHLLGWWWNKGNKAGADMCECGHSWDEHEEEEDNAYCMGVSQHCPCKRFKQVRT